MRLSASFGLFLPLVFSLSAADQDLVTYGGTPAGLTAAIAAHLENPDLKITIVKSSPRIGGVVTGCLSRTDKGRDDRIGESGNVHDISVEILRKRLIGQNAVLELKGLADLIIVKKLPGIANEDREADFVGSRSHSSFGNPVEGSAAHDENRSKGEKSATLTIEVPDRLFTTLGTWAFANGKPAVTTIRNKKTNSFVSVDAIQFLPVE